MNMLTPSLAFATVALLAAACTPAAGDATPAPEEIEIRMHRSACFGTCPVYTVTIHGDGRVEYDGERFVGVEGHQEATVSPDEVRALAQEFEEAGFFEMEDEYTANVTDLPTTTVSVRIGARTKEVVDYFDAPEALRRLEQRVDEVAGTEQWVAIPAGATGTP